MKGFVSDLMFVIVLALALWVGAWFAGDIVGYRRQVNELAAQLEAVNDRARDLEYRMNRLKAKVGSAAAEVLERRLTPEESYELLLRALPD